jgi:fucose 4-O-acetylase-like acetyltransferase
MVGVVFIHTAFSPSTDFFSQYLYNLGSRILPHVCVPLFFGISGFFFFYGSRFSIDTYINKLKRRARTLLLPYVLWISAWLAFYYALQYSGLLRLEKRVEYDWNHILSAYWDGTQAPGEDLLCPILGQFWFLRDLMCVIVLSPLIFFGIKKLGILFPMLLASAWFFDWQQLRPLVENGQYLRFFTFFSDIGNRGLSLYAVFFFSLGAWFSLKKQRFIDPPEWARKFSFFLFPALAILEAFLAVQKYAYNPILHRATILAGIPFAINLSTILVEKEIARPKKFLVPVGFYLYALHTPWLALVYKRLTTVTILNSEGAFIVNYLLLPVFAILFCCALHAILNRFTPRLDNMLTGGR